MKCLLFFFVIVGTPGLSIATTEQERDSVRTLVYWLPASWCGERRLVRNCVKWTGTECEQQIKNFADSCLKLTEPKMMKDRIQPISHWRKEVFRCTLREVELQMAARLVQSEICKNMVGQL